MPWVAFTVRVCWSIAKFAVTVLSPVISTVTVSVDALASPVQPANW